MKTCSSCGQSVADDDGLQLTDGRFFCKSGGCQKKFLDGVFEREVIPDLLRSGGQVVRVVDADSPAKTAALPVLEKGPAEFCRECELCHRVQIEGRRYRFYYGKKTPGIGWRLWATEKSYEIAGQENAWICRKCVSRRRWLSYGLLVVLLLLAAPLPILWFAGSPVSPFLPPLALVVFGLYFITIPPRGEQETAERLAIGIKKRALRQQGHNAFLTAARFARLRRSGQPGGPVDMPGKIRWWFVNWRISGGRDRLVTALILGLPILLCCGWLLFTGLIQPLSHGWVYANLEQYLQLPNHTVSESAYLRGRVLILDLERKQVDSLHDKLPGELRARRHEEVGTVVWLKRSTEKVGYYLVGGGSAMQHVWEVTIIDFVSGAMVDQRVFRGSQPPSTVYCRSDSPCNAFGDEPIDKVLNFLKSLPRTN